MKKKERRKKSEKRRKKKNGMKQGTDEQKQMIRKDAVS